MNINENEIKRLKSAKFSRTYRDATGVHYHQNETDNKFPWTLLVIILFILLVLL
jgi:hypothetical protein